MTIYIYMCTFGFARLGRLLGSKARILLPVGRRQKLPHAQSSLRRPSAAGRPLTHRVGRPPQLPPPVRLLRLPPRPRWAAKQCCRLDFSSDALPRQHGRPRQRQLGGNRHRTPRGAGCLSLRRCRVGRRRGRAEGISPAPLHAQKKNTRTHEPVAHQQTRRQCGQDQGLILFGNGAHEPSRR